MGWNYELGCEDANPYPAGVVSDWAAQVEFERNRKRDVAPAFPSIVVDGGVYSHSKYSLIGTLTLHDRKERRRLGFDRVTSVAVKFGGVRSADLQRVDLSDEGSITVEAGTVC